MEETARTNRSARSTTDDHQPIHKDEPASSMETHEGDEGVTRGSDQILQRRLIQDAAIRLTLPETENDQDSPTHQAVAELVASEETACSHDGGGNLVRMGTVGRPPSSTRYERGDGQPNEEQEVAVEMADTRLLTRMQLMRNRAASVVINAEKRSNLGGGEIERRMSQPTEEKTAGPPALLVPPAAGATPPYSSLRRHQSDGTTLETDASTIRPSLDRQVSLPGAFSIPGPGGGGVQGRLGTHEEDILVHVRGRACRRRP